MLPTVVPVGYENIVENHRAQPQHENFSWIPNIQGRVIAVRLQFLPADSFLIAEARNTVSQDVAQKSEFIPFVTGIRRNDHPIFEMKQQNLTAFRI